MSILDAVKRYVPPAAVDAIYDRLSDSLEDITDALYDVVDTFSKEAGDALSDVKVFVEGQLFDSNSSTPQTEPTAPVEDEETVPLREQVARWYDKNGPASSKHIRNAESDGASDELINYLAKNIERNFDVKFDR